MFVHSEEVHRTQHRDEPAQRFDAAQRLIAARGQAHVSHLLPRDGKLLRDAPLRRQQFGFYLRVADFEPVGLLLHLMEGLLQLPPPALGVCQALLQDAPLGIEIRQALPYGALPPCKCLPLPLRYLQGVREQMEFPIQDRDLALQLVAPPAQRCVHTHVLIDARLQSIQRPAHFGQLHPDVCQLGCGRRGGRQCGAQAGLHLDQGLLAFRVGVEDGGLVFAELDGFRFQRGALGGGLRSFGVKVSLLQRNLLELGVDQPRRHLLLGRGSLHSGQVRLGLGDRLGELLAVTRHGTPARFGFRRGGIDGRQPALQGLDLVRPAKERSVAIGFAPHADDAVCGEQLPLQRDDAS